MRRLVRRSIDPELYRQLDDLNPVLRRVYAARNLLGRHELERSLNLLPSPWLMTGMDTLVFELKQALEQDQRILVLGDIDADGATSTAVAVRGLRLLGAGHVDYLVPNRFKHGYGLTPEIVAEAALRDPHVLITVDNGVSAHEGVAAAHARGMRVLITDHHLPGKTLPIAEALVNPNQQGDTFPSQSLAGVGVIFYVLLALRARLRDSDWFARRALPEPNLGQLLDLVALGTVADVVPLDHVNRILVHQGLQRIRAQRAQPGLQALLSVAGRNPDNLVAADLGFAVAPRLNAAGRLDDMSVGIECLLCDDYAQALVFARQLDELNRERKVIEEQMKNDAYALLEQLYLDDMASCAGACLYDESWHPGVIGIVAARVKDRLHRPVIAFAPGSDHELKGSARSIPGVHIRDLLSEIATSHPGLMLRFGGHAMAAGLSIETNVYPSFVTIFNATVQQHLEQTMLEKIIHTDGELAVDEMDLQVADILQQAGPWGQHFPGPVFDGEFVVSEARVVAEKHLKLLIVPHASSHPVEGIAFFVDEPESWLGCKNLRLAYQLDINYFRKQRQLQFRIDYLEKL